MSILFLNEYRSGKILDYIQSQIGGYSIQSGVEPEHSIFIIKWVGPDPNTEEELFFEHKYSFDEIRSVVTPMVIAQSFIEAFNQFMKERENEQSSDSEV